MATKDITDKQVCQSALAQESHLYVGCDALSILAKMTHEPEKVCVGAIERAVRRRLVDYGTSLRFIFITDAGRALLAETTPLKP